jgi:3-deoxy-D-manno-octulosonate 8-phosphate phosphatase (KDO 8-P phosphatase)
MPAQLQHMQLLVLDVDGVLTDGRLYYGPDGEMIKTFHVRDGAGIKAVLAAGIEVAVISGRRTPAVDARCRELGINHVEQGCDDKPAAFQRLLDKLHIAASDAICVVDDTTDLTLMRACGCSVAVADSHALVLKAADRVTTLAGGLGAVREVCDWLLAAKQLRQ